MSARPMRRALAGLALAASAAVAIAAPAAALPDLRIDRTVPGWSAPIVLSQSNTSNANNAFEPSSMLGDAQLYWNTRFTNIGNAPAFPVLSAFSIDGDVVFEGSHGTLAPGGVISLLNNAQYVRGGLHTLKIAVNPSGAFVEDSTANNAFARQLHLRATTLTPGSVVTRSAPPQPYGGTDVVEGTVYPNQDGVRAASGNVWQAVALRPPVGQDYDLELYSDTPFTNAGFRTPLKSSTFGTGATDFIVMNPFTAFFEAHEFGVLYFSGAMQPYGIELRTSAGPTLVSGSTYSGLTLAANQMLDVRQYQHVPSPSAPRMAFELTTTPGVVLHVALFSDATTIASRSGALANVVTDATGRAVLDIALETTGNNKNYAIAVFRDQADGGTAEATYTLRIRPTPADLANDVHAGNTVPVNASNGASNWTTDPTTLDGDVANTNFSFYFNNSGAATASTYRIDTRLDGVSLLPFSPGPIAPGGTIYQAVAPLNVRGGRHTLSYALDIDGAIDETYETNNSYGRQFVWSPKVLTAGATLLRNLPPPATGGLDAIPASVPAFANCDGFRTDPAKLGGPNSLANVVAVMPTPGADVDLTAHALSTGPLHGFDTVLASSTRSEGDIDLVAWCSDLATPQYDAGVERYAGTNQSYVIQNVFSTWNPTIDPATLGPDSLPATSIVRAFSFQRGAHPNMTVILDNLSGDADLGMSIFQYGSSGPQPITGSMPNALVDAVGPGINEGTIVSTSSGLPYFAIVVWKKNWSEFNKNAKFRLRIDPVTADVTPALVHAVAFAIAGDNPTAGPTKLRFDLPQAAPVSIDLLDLQGRRVRSIASGMRSSGSHTLAFDGFDDAGQRLRNGAYFVRFSSGDITRVHKLVVLH